MTFKNLPDGKITRAVVAAIAKREKLVAEGMDVEVIDTLIGADLKAVWQASRNEPWHYYCERCKDSGMIVVQPTYVEQKRLARLYGDNPQYQDYMQPCDPCHWRDMQRANRSSRSTE